MPIVDQQAIQARVRAQYEVLPYPARNPDDERKRLVMTGMDDLLLINHFCFGGRKDFSRKCRILVAGGGTGDAIVYLAYQLRDTSTELVYLDLSEASLKIAQQRIRVRGLQNKVMWVQGSLLDIDQYHLGKFDYINCSGVLHHLPDPPAGLRALRNCLQPDGAIGLMLYAAYGRTGIYHMQSLLRTLNSDTHDPALKLERTRAVLQTLPPSNWYQRGQELFHSITKVDDTELYDLLLHNQDRAYTIPELYGLLDEAGLDLVEFTAENRLLFDPAAAFRDADLLARVRQLPRREQHAVCEAFWGCVTKHICWATMRSNTIADVHNESLAPCFTHLADVLDVRRSYLKQQGEAWSLSVQVGQRKTQLRLLVDDATRIFFELADSVCPLSRILLALQQRLGFSPERARGEVHEVIGLLVANDLLVLRDPSLPLMKR